MQKHANLVDLVKSFPHVPFLNLLFEQIAYSNEYLLAQFGFDTAENEPLKVHSIIQPWDLIFTEPPRRAAQLWLTALHACWRVGWRVSRAAALLQDVLYGNHKVSPPLSSLAENSDLSFVKFKRFSF